MAIPHQTNNSAGSTSKQTLHRHPCEVRVNPQGPACPPVRRCVLCSCLVKWGQKPNCCQQLSKHLLFSWVRPKLWFPATQDLIITVLYVLPVSAYCISSQNGHVQLSALGVYRRPAIRHNTSCCICTEGYRLRTWFVNMPEYFFTIPWKLVKPLANNGALEQGHRWPKRCCCPSWMWQNVWLVQVLNLCRVRECQSEDACIRPEPGVRVESEILWIEPELLKSDFAPTRSAHIASDIAREVAHMLGASVDFQCC